MKYILIILFTIFILDAQPKWEKIDEITNLSRLGKFEVVNNKFVTILSLYDTRPSTKSPGLVYFSKDTGKTFEKIFLADSTIDTSKTNPFYKEILIGMAYSDTNLCIVTGNNGIFYKSYDNLKTWDKLIDTTYDVVAQIYFDNNNKGLMVVKKYFQFWYIYKSSDNGEYWKRLNNDSNSELLNDPKYEPIMYLELFDNDNIFIMQSQKNYVPPKRFLYSSDFGESWDYWDDKNIEILGPYILSRDLSIGFKNVLAEGKTDEYNIEFYRSRDFGKNYQKVFEIKEYFKKDGLISWNFCDTLNGIACTPTMIFRTTDGGLTWFKDLTFDYKEFPELISNIVLINPNVALLYGQYYLYRMDYSKTGGLVIDDAKEIKINEIISADYIDLSKINLLSDKVNLHYSIYDYNGKKMIDSKIQNSRIELNHLLNGTYILIINDENEKYYSKFLLDKK